MFILEGEFLIISVDTDISMTIVSCWRGHSDLEHGKNHKFHRSNAGGKNVSWYGTGSHIMIW